MLSASHDREMRRLQQRLMVVAKTTLPVLVTGESGTGKEVLARQIHAAGAGHGAPFVAVNLAAIPEELFEAELFGVEPGAFTGARARRVGRFEQSGAGTLLLDEVGCLQPRLQVKLLRVLQERSFQRLGSSTSIDLRARVVAATNEDLARLVRDGDFRADLYYRLAVVHLHVPALRERPDDIPAHARHFLADATPHGTVRRLSPGAIDALVAYPWPGNVRELDNAMTRLALQCPSEIASERDVAAILHHGTRAPAWETDQRTLEETVLAAIGRAVQECDGDIRQAAERLGVSRATVYRRVAQAGRREEAARAA